MKLTVLAKILPAKNGIMLEAVGLAAFGKTRRIAQIELERGITGWCYALRRANALDGALYRAKLRLEDDGDPENIYVSVE